MQKLIYQLQQGWKMLSDKFRDLLDYFIGKCGLEKPDSPSIPARIWLLMENKLGFSLFMISVASVFIVAVLGGAFLMKAAATMFLVFVGLTIVILQIPKATRMQFLAYCVRYRIWIDGLLTILGLWAIFGAVFGVTTSFIWAFFLIGVSAYLSMIDWYGKSMDPAFPYADEELATEPELALA